MQKRITYFLKYSLLFVISALVSYALFIYYGKGFVAKGDGLRQHYMSLIYYARYIRTIAGNIFIDHKLTIPTYTFGIGYGGDIVSTLSYYVLGNPITILSALVPDKWMHIFYYAVIFIRLYLGGLAFSAYCFYKDDKKDDFSVLVPAITYVFCTYVLHAATVHPYFSVPLIWTPLLFIGIEKIIKDEKHLPFIIFVAFAALSNFYFFYMEVIFVIIYGIYNVCTNCNKKIVTLLLMLRDGIIGCLIAAPVLLPTIFKIISDPRTKSEYRIVPFYNLDYYRRMLQSIFLSADVGYWALPGSTFLAALGIIYIFTKKKSYRGHILALLAGIVAFCIPYCGYILNGKSYVSNRWSWMFIFITSVIACEYLNDLKDQDEKTLKIRWMISLIYFGIVSVITFIYSGVRYQIDVYSSILFVFIVLAFESFYINKKQPAWTGMCLKGLILLLTIGSFGIHGYLVNSYYYDVYADNYIDIDEDIYSTAQNSNASQIKEIADKDTFYRISGSNFTDNQPLLQGISSTQYYWSLSDSSSYTFLREMGVPITSNYHFRGLNGRTALNSLLGVEYIIDKGKKGQPYNAKKCKTDDKLTYLYNENAMPLIYAYDKVASKDLFESLDMVGRQELILDSAIVEPQNEDILDEQKSFVGTAVSQNIEIKTEGDIVADSEQRVFTVGPDGGVLHISFEGLKECETYLCLNGLYYVQPKTSDNKWIDFLNKEESKNHSVKIKAKQGDEDFSQTTIKTSDAYFKWTNDMHDFVVNSGYSEDVTDGFDVTLEKEGTYSFSEISVKCQPMDSFKEAMHNRTDGIKTNVSIDSDNAAYAISEIKADIELSSDKLVVINLPYGKGWSAYVDGQKTELNKVNIMLMGTFMSAGKHELVLKYRTPGLLPGVLFGIITVIFMVIYICIKKKDKKEVVLNEEHT